MPGSIAGQVTDWMKRLQQVAAELIMAHRWFGADAFDENVVRDQGAHDSTAASTKSMSVADAAK